ncbi:DUF4142 domain-containing protein [Bordetella genomosp. 8]|nr:DUF4142 domain-containing protein [Bordetella genomosp. 8]
MKHWVRIIGVSLLWVTGPCLAQAQEVDRADAAFMERAAQAGSFEIAASQLAQRKAEHDEVKRYARTMLDEHADMAGQLKALAAARKVSLPGAISSSQTHVMEALDAKNGTDFDLAYADDVAIAAHQAAVALFVDAAEHGKDPEVKAFAQQMLPNLKAHLDAGLALRKSLAASGKASPEESAPAASSGAPGAVSPASREAPPTLLPGDKGAPKP